MFDRNEFKQILYDVNSRMGNYFSSYRVGKNGEANEIIRRRGPDVKRAVKNIAPMIVIEKMGTRPYRLVVDDGVFKLYSKDHAKAILASMAAGVKFQDMGYGEVLGIAQDLIKYTNSDLSENKGFESFLSTYINGLHSVMCEQISFDHGFMPELYKHVMGSLGLMKMRPSWREMSTPGIEYNPVNDLVNLFNTSYGSPAFHVAGYKNEAQAIDNLTKEVLAGKLSDKGHLSRYETFRDSFCVNRSVTPSEIVNNFSYAINF